MRYDVIVIGAGLSGLAAASLLAKSGLKVAVVDKAYNPGGSCGTFKRNMATFDQGSAMLYGFGEHGFNAHRFIFNCLEEPIQVLKHDLLYVVNFKGERIRFFADVPQFADELSRVFPSESENIHRFYRDMTKLYQHVMVENPAYCTPDETEPKIGLRSLSKHPLSYLRFLSYMNKSSASLLGKYFTNPEIIKFFDKLTSTYCYATVEEAPAILAAVMFVDNHTGGSYYPAGSTMFLPGKMEKVIEENHGEMIMETEVVRILFKDSQPYGVELKDGRQLFADNLVYSGTVWNLYDKLIDPQYSTPERRQWAADQVPTYPSVVLYAQVKKDVIPEGTAPVEMLVGNPDEIDESEVTVYMFSIDDHTLCASNSHMVMAIGPSFEEWKNADSDQYRQKKEQEKQRLIAVLEKRFPGFGAGIQYAEVATPRTIERYCNKNGGAVAGPKQMLGQHMFKRLHTRTEWDTLYCCGESTVMGTGTPTVTTTGISAANAILKKLGKQTYAYKPGMKNYVEVLEVPFEPEQLYQAYPPAQREVMLQASRCQFCLDPVCQAELPLNIRGMMRRVAVGNIYGATQIARRIEKEIPLSNFSLPEAEKLCVMNKLDGSPVTIQAISAYLLEA